MNQSSEEEINFDKVASHFRTAFYKGRWPDEMDFRLADLSIEEAH